MNPSYPNGKDFIFTIFDDTDVSTLNYIRPIYDTLHDLDLRTTKSVWPLSYEGDSDHKGSHTLENEGYAEYIKDLDERAFEISFHGASMESSTREKTERALKLFYDLLGYYPRSYASHSLNRENLYWGPSRFTVPLFRVLYRILTNEKERSFLGHVDQSPFFWGDLASEYIDYVRNFTYNEINLLNISKALPYSNSRQSLVKNWFFTSDADNVEEFNRLIREENIDKLERQKGVCIVSTHFGKGFVRQGRLHRRTENLLRNISRRNGWFVPVSTALDFLKSQRKGDDIKYTELMKLELYWIVHSGIRRKRALQYHKTETEYLGL